MHEHFYFSWLHLILRPARLWELSGAHMNSLLKKRGQETDSYVGL